MATKGTGSAKGGRKAGVPAPAAPAAPSFLAQVTLRIPSGDLRFTPVDDRLRTARSVQRAAITWGYVVRNRQRWAERAKGVDDQAARARTLLGQLGLAEADRERLAQAGRVEVAIPYEVEAQGWEARIFPWEYVLTAGTRDLRRGAPLIVMRRLVRGKARAGAPRAVQRVLHVESAPGGLTWSFEPERDLVRSNLAATSFEVLSNPTRRQLADAVAAHRPDVIHLAGFDTHQGLELLGQGSKDAEDGFLLRADDGGVDPVSAADLGALVGGGPRPPGLVVCAFFNSAARVAPALVAAGAGGAIGVQDLFETALAELFLAHFYETLRLTGGRLGEAFEVAWQRLRRQANGLSGTGMVLWSAAPVLAPPVRAARQTAIAAEIDARNRRPLTLADATDGDARSLLSVEVKPLTEINYSLLHNNRALFEAFTLRKLRPGRLASVFVGVELHVGTDSYPYRCTLDLTEPVTDLTGRIRVPLTSALARTAHERVHTSLFVEVQWGKEELYRETHRVTLLPVDEWRDDDADRIWLPSFVLPRDPAVARIIDAGQRYLMAIQDDPTAGFDGYQSFDPEADEPAAAVDRQVQAIWSAIVYDFRLGYINPPPAYSLASQRVRTPSDILAGGRGTCLDLALLLASCLELIDIYPVVFLLEGHAFPGYWRNPDAYEAFQEVAATDVVDLGPGDARRPPSATGQREPWYFAKATYPELIQQVRRGELVPLEAVWLTAHKGFGEAIDGGHENLRSRREFHSMLDVIQARRHMVTPLPILRGDA